MAGLPSLQIPIPLTGSIDTKTDPKVINPPHLYLIENGYRRIKSRIEKRDGCAAFPQSVNNATTLLTNADALATFGDDLLQFNNQELYSYSPNAQVWTDKGPAISVKVSTRRLLDNDYQQTQVDQAVNGNVGLVAWEDSRGGVRCSVYDLITGSNLVTDALLNASASRPRVVSFGSALYVFYIVSNSLLVRIISPKAPLPLGTELTISTSVNGTPSLDVIVHDAFILVGYNATAAATTTLQKVNAAGNSTAVVNLGEASTNCLALVKGPGATTFVAYQGAPGLRGAIYDVNLNQTVAPFTIDAIGGLTANAVTGYALPDGSGVRFFYEINAAQTYNRYVRKCFVSSAGAPSGAAVFLRSVGLATKAFAYAPRDTSDKGFVGLVYDSPTQATFFVARSDGTIAARFQAGNAGGVLSRSLPSGVSILAPGVFGCALLTKNPVVSVGNNKFLSLKGVSATQLDFSTLSAFPGESLGGNAHFAGGVLQCYDGAQVVEHNFNVYPENFTLASSAGGALTTPGTYQYTVTYEWTDSAGQLHRSTTGIPVSITLAGDQTVTVTIPTLRLTSKTAVKIAVWRTPVNGTVFNLATSATSFLLNDPTVDTVTFVDAQADTALASKELLYTTGNVLDNAPAPACTLICRFADRLAVAGTEDDSVQLSKLRAAGKPVAFSSPPLIVQTDPRGGKTKAIDFLEDKLIIFKEREIYWINGDGPDDTGNGAFSQPKLITAELGAADGGIVAQCPKGLIFRSDKGFWLLDPSLNLSYVGDRVEAYNDLVVTSATVITDQNQIRFTTTAGPRLVYDYYFDEWYVWTYGAADSVQWLGLDIHIRHYSNAASIVVYETPGQCLDVAQYYPLRIGLGWLSLASFDGASVQSHPMGFFRVRKIGLEGDFYSPHKLLVSVGYDDNDVFYESHVWDPVEALQLNTYGDAGIGEQSPDDGTYGSVTPYGGGSSAYHVSIGNAQQKVKSIKVLIEDTAQSGSGKSFSLSVVALEVAGKAGMSRVGDRRTI